MHTELTHDLRGTEPLPTKPMHAFSSNIPQKDGPVL